MPALELPNGDRVSPAWSATRRHELHWKEFPTLTKSFTLQKNLETKGLVPEALRRSRGPSF